jgi:HEXXH motif-containing protein
MLAGLPSHGSSSPRIQLEEASFDPCAERARRLDARMRERLAESVRYVAAQAATHLRVPSDSLARFLERLARGPVSPHAFAAYYDLVLALDADDLGEAAQRMGELLAAPAAQDGLRVLALGDAARDRDADRIRRHVDTDPEQPLEILPPPPELVAACRERIEAALELLDAGHPELVAEIRALVREIVLAVGSAAPGAWRFDGASSFMLWGVVVLNAGEHGTRLEMVQALAHESAHNLLFGLCADGPLVSNDDVERFASPLRVDPRPIDGIFHATFVTARMHQAVARLREAGALAAGERAEAERALATSAALFAQGVATLDRHAQLTPMGQAALAGARATMQRAAW